MEENKETKETKETKKLHIEKKKIPILVAMVVVIIFGFFMIKSTFSKGISTSEKVREGFSVIKDVAGVEFYINTSSLNSATAVAHISNKVNFSTNMYYSYKDSERYLLFNMNGLVLVAEKGTEFGFSNADSKSAALKKGNICGITFEEPEDGTEYLKSGSKVSANVNAEVVITNTLYGDFCGVLTTVTDGSEEWSIFAGVVGDDVEEVDDTVYDQLKYMSNSIRLVEASQEETKDAYAVEIGSTEKESVSVVEKEEPDITEPEPEENKGMDISNQEEIIKVDTKAYSSNIYSLLNMGDKGIFHVLNDEKLVYEEPIIDITGLLTGKEAENYLKEIYKDTYKEPAAGCAYHVITYNLYYKTCLGTPYVNIKLRGLDGENLKFRGIQYSKRTHDYFDNVTEENEWNTGYVCYYEVPNGCLEYVLECGDGSVASDTITAAYYLINISQTDN